KCTGCRAVLVVPAVAANSATRTAQAAPKAVDKPSTGLRSSVGQRAPSGQPAVPQASAVREPSPQTLVREIDSGFQGEVPPPRQSPFYSLAAAFSAVMLVLVPIGYVAIVLLAGWLLLAIAGWDVSGATVRTMSRLLVFKWLAVAGGCVTMIFLLRPLLLLVWPRPRMRSGTPVFRLDEQPVLAALVKEIGHRLGTPIPTHVQFNCLPNAAAARLKEQGMFSQRRMI